MSENLLPSDGDGFDVDTFDEGGHLQARKACIKKALFSCISAAFTDACFIADAFSEENFSNKRPDLPEKAPIQAANNNRPEFNLQKPTESTCYIQQEPFIALTQQPKTDLKPKQGPLKASKQKVENSCPGCEKFEYKMFMESTRVDFSNIGSIDQCPVGPRGVKKMCPAFNEKSLQLLAGSKNPTLWFQNGFAYTTIKKFYEYSEPSHQQKLQKSSSVIPETYNPNRKFIDEALETAERMIIQAKTPQEFYSIIGFIRKINNRLDAFIAQRFQQMTYTLKTAYNSNNERNEVSKKIPQIQNIQNPPTPVVQREPAFFATLSTFDIPRVLQNKTSGKNIASDFKIASPEVIIDEVRNFPNLSLFLESEHGSGNVEQNLQHESEEKPSHEDQDRSSNL